MALLSNGPFMSGTLIWLSRQLKHQNMSTGDNFIHIVYIIFLVLFLATREVVVPANDSIMLGRSIWLFRHLKHQNMSTGDDFIHRSGLVWTFIHPKRQNLSMISDSIDKAK